MTDIATIGFKADTKGLEKAEDALDDVTRASKRTDKATDSLASSQNMASKSATAQAAANNKNAGSMRNMRGVAQQFGWQMQDVAVQLQAGTSGLVVFTQQGSQMAAAFGPAGAIVGALLAVGGAAAGALLPSLMDSGKAMDDLGDRALALADDLNALTDAQMAAVQEGTSLAVRRQNEAIQQQIDTVDDLKEKLQELNDENGRVITVYDSMGIATHKVIDNNEKIAATEERIIELGIVKVEQEQKLKELSEGRASEAERLIQSLEDQYYQLTLNNEEMADYIVRQTNAGEVESIRIKGLMKLIEQEEAAKEAAKAKADANAKIDKSLQSIIDKYTKQSESLSDLTEEQKTLNLIQREGIDENSDLAKSAIEAAKGYDTLTESQKQAAKAAAQLKADEAMAENVMNAIDPMRQFREESERVRDLFDKGLLGDTTLDQLDEYLDKLEDAASANQNAFDLDKTFDSVIDGLGQVRGTMDEGSKAAQKLGQVMQVLQVAQGISAILNQGMGDPYTAIARMAAMAAAVASLIGSTGFSGSGDATAANAQAVQGTGTVLGDPTGKSESISKAVDITADATSELVGINRGMLTALQNMQEGIASATGMIIRGGSGDFAGAMGSTSIFDVTGSLPGRMNMRQFDVMNMLGLDFLGDFLGDALGGKSKVVNEGILIVGGAITDMVDNVMVEAFQDIKSKKHFLDDSDTRRKTQQIGGEVADQLGLVFGSMIDAVAEAAGALGLNEGMIQSRIDRFRLAEIEISTKDLSGEEQQAELEAVFSSIFDGLAASVVPFVDQFQQVGEGMAETLIRVATQVQVTEEAVDQLGLSLLDNKTPEQIAQIADQLTNATGNLGDFISGLKSFVNNFASEEQALAITTNQITRAMEQMNFALPDTRDGLWDLMQSLTDPSDVAQLIGLTDALDDYYSAIEKAKAEQDALNAAISSERESLTVQLLQAQGKAQEALNLQREIALRSINENNKALQEQVWAAQDAAEAQRIASEIEAESSSLSIALLVAQGENEAALNLQREIALGAINEANKALQEQVWAAEDAAESERILADERSEKRGLIVDLLKAQGKEEAALNLQRDIALESISENNKALQQQIWATQDATKAEQDLRDARISATDSALGNLRSAIDERIEEVQQSFAAIDERAIGLTSSRISVAQQNLDKKLGWFDDAIDSTGESISRLSSISSEISAAINSNVVSSQSISMARRVSAERQINSALMTARAGGGIGDISGALSALSVDQSGMFGSLFEEQRSLSLTANRLSDLGSITEDQISSEEKMIELLEERKLSAERNSEFQIRNLEAIREGQLQRNNDAKEAEINALERQYEIYADEIDALRGIEEFTGSINDAIYDLKAALADEMALEQINETQKQTGILVELNENIKQFKEESAQYNRSIADTSRKTAIETERRNIIEESAA